MNIKVLTISVLMMTSILGSSFSFAETIRDRTGTPIGTIKDGVYRDRTGTPIGTVRDGVYRDRTGTPIGTIR